MSDLNRFLDRALAFMKRDCLAEGLDIHLLPDSVHVNQSPMLADVVDLEISLRGVVKSCLPVVAGDVEKDLLVAELGRSQTHALELSKRIVDLTEQLDDREGIDKNQVMVAVDPSESEEDELLERVRLKVRAQYGTAHRDVLIEFLEWAGKAWGNEETKSKLFQKMLIQRMVDGFLDGVDATKESWTSFLDSLAKLDKKEANDALAGFSPDHVEIDGLSSKIGFVEYERAREIALSPSLVINKDDVDWAEITRRREIRKWLRVSLKKKDCED